MQDKAKIKCWSFILLNQKADEAEETCVNWVIQNPWQTGELRSNRAGTDEKISCSSG